MGLRLLIHACKGAALTILAVVVFTTAHIRHFLPQTQQSQQRQEQQRQQLQQFLQQTDQAAQDPWRMSSFDMVQNNQILEINEHLQHTDAAVTELNKTVAELGREQSQAQGSESVWNSILGALILGSIGFQMWKGKEKSS